MLELGRGGTEARRLFVLLVLPAQRPWRDVLRVDATETLGTLGVENTPWLCVSVAFIGAWRERVVRDRPLKNDRRFRINQSDRCCRSASGPRQVFVNESHRDRSLAHG